LADYENLLSIGKIVGTHGIKGVLRVFSYAESVSRFSSGLLLHSKNPGGGEKVFKIKWAKPHSKVILISLEGIANRSEAEALLGSELFIRRDLLEEPEEGTYFWFDIIGLAVFSVDDDYIGRVTSIMETGSNDVYVVTCPAEKDTKEVLVPALTSVIKSIDLEKKIMTVDLPEGL
jgi:16S rRNA processing protein RimM